MQCTSARLLLNLVEVVHARRADVASAERHRALLARTLDAFVDRLASLRDGLADVLPLEGEDKGGEEGAAASSAASSSAPPDPDRSRRAADARMLLARCAWA